MPAPLPLVRQTTIPPQKNQVPMVATSEGMPNRTTMSPFSRPTPRPAASPARRPSSGCPTATNTQAPTAITEPNERSISRAITTSVSESAIIPVNGTDDISEL